MDERPIKVNFPKKMEVHDPQIDSMNKTVNTLSKWLQENFNKIITSLQTLNKLPDMLTEFNKNMVEQFRKLFINRIEAEAVSRHANIKANQFKITAIKNHISKKAKQLEESKDRIQKRYKNTLNNLKFQHEKHLKNLDNHAYNIMDNIYPKKVQEKFSYSSIPTQQLLVAKGLQSVIDRTSCINENFNKIENSIDNFLNRREEFRTNIAEISKNMLDSGSYHLPSWFIELEDEEGNRKIEVHFEWDFNEDKRKILKDDMIIKCYEYGKVLAKEKTETPRNSDEIKKIAGKLGDFNVRSSEQMAFFKECSKQNK